MKTLVKNSRRELLAKTIAVVLPLFSASSNPRLGKRDVSLALRQVLRVALSEHAWACEFATRAPKSKPR